jgi:RIP homotypic interaction motif
MRHYRPGRARCACELVLARHEQDPQVWNKPLAGELAAAVATEDQDLVAAAQAVMRLVYTAGSAAGKYQVVVHDSQGVQIGDHNAQHNLFGPAAGH